MFFNKQEDKLNLSLPKTRRVCGYEIKKLSIGGYLNAVERIKTLPTDFLEKCFQGKEVDEILNMLINLDTKSISEIATSLFVTAPSYIVGFVAELTGIPEEKLINDPNIGLTGFAEIILAFLEVNDLGKFVSVAGEAAVKIKEMKITPTLTTGYKG